MPVRYTCPAYPSGDPPSTARTTPTYSSIIGSGANGAMPNRVFMIELATPRPSTNRPPEAWSSCAAVLAVSTGGRSAALAIAVPTRTRRVEAATGWHSASASPCPSATNTALNPASSAAPATAPTAAGGSPLCDAIDNPRGPSGPTELTSRRLLSPAPYPCRNDFCRTDSPVVITRGIDHDNDRPSCRGQPGAPGHDPGARLRRPGDLRAGT